MKNGYNNKLVDISIAKPTHIVDNVDTFVSPIVSIIIIVVVYISHSTGCKRTR